MSFNAKSIPSDPHIRAVLDEMTPESLQPSFDDALRTLERCGDLEHFQRLDGRLLVVPGITSGLHLMSEFIENADEPEKQDCEWNATKRILPASLRH